MRDKLLYPDLLAEGIAEFQRESHKERLATLSARGDAERKLAKVTKELENLVTAITEGMFQPSLKAKMATLEAERADLEARLAALPEPEPVAIHPELAEAYARRVADLATALNEPAIRIEAADLLRGMIESVTLTPDPDAPDGHVIDLCGALGAILSLCENGLGQNAKARSVATGVRQVTMVAGAGFEPAAFRL